MKTNTRKRKASKPRTITVAAWVEIFGKRAETTFVIESPLVCEGACPVLQMDADSHVAGMVFRHHVKTGFGIKH
jgi:hypothetical protein